MIFDSIKEYVKQGNIQYVRRELLRIFNANPDLGDGIFQDNLKYSEENLTADILYDKYSDDFEMLQDESLWDTSYVSKIYLHLRREFSKEMVEHLLQVAPVAYHDKVIQRDLLKQTSIKAREGQLEERYPVSNLWGNCEKIVKLLIIILLILVVIVVVLSLI